MAFGGGSQLPGSSDSGFLPWLSQVTLPQLLAVARCYLLRCGRIFWQPTNTARVKLEAGEADEVEEAEEEEEAFRRNEFEEDDIMPSTGPGPRFNMKHSPTGSIVLSQW